jgi:hypothetical protein
MYVTYPEARTELRAEAHLLTKDNSGMSVANA